MGKRVLAQVGEDEWITLIQSYLDTPEYLGKEDDAVAIPPSDSIQLINIDGLVFSTDVPIALKPKPAGYRAVINAISDIIVKGGIPQTILLSLSLPNTYFIEDSLEIIKGVRKACDKYELKFLGGDLNQANDVVVDVVVVGTLDNRLDRPVPRISNTLLVGDHLYWIGPKFGETALALQLLLGKLPETTYSSKLVTDYEYPNTYPEFREVLGSLGHKIKSSIDCSDGLVKSLYQLIKGTERGIVLDKRKIGINISHNLFSQQEYQMIIDEAVYYGGEELGIIFAADQHLTDLELKILAKYNAIQIGAVSEAHSVSLDSGEILEFRGWTHFSS